MTQDEARQWVERIKDIADDDEVAHGSEDELREAVLKAIANGLPADEAQALARIALQTGEIRFSRWCA